METHAQYHHNNPLPVCGVIFGRLNIPAEPPKEGVGRVIKQCMAYPKDHAPKAKNTSAMTADAVRERYVSCLSTTRWTSAAEISTKLDLHATSVCKAMSGKTMADLVKVKKDGYRLVWKLKAVA